MPEGYNEIPGVYSETPRPLAGVRRTLRTYRKCLSATGFLLVIILMAVTISLLISTTTDDQSDERNTTPEAVASAQQQSSRNHEEERQNRTIERLLSLSWPRRDETWYKKRWERTHMRCPFHPRTSSSSWDNCPSTQTRRTRRAAPLDAEEEDESDDYFLKRHFSGYFNQDEGDSGDESGEEDSFLGDSGEGNDGSTFPPDDSFNWNRNASNLPECSVKAIGEAMLKGSEMEESKVAVEEELSLQNISLRRYSPSFYHQKAFRKTSPRAGLMSRQGFRIDHASKEIAHRLKLNKEERTFDTRWLGDLSQSPYCDYEIEEHKCSRRNIYRSADGSCNNLRHPTWGAAFTPFRRALPPDYADGVLTPRRGVNEEELPSARLVSVKVHQYKRVHSRSYTHLTMTFGQFVDHDITATAQAKSENGSSISCCHEEVLNNTSLRHPECFEIPIPEEDSFFRNQNMTCMEFSRSAPAPRCHFGPREQLNQNTHFLDGSIIYGSSPDEMNKLRTHKDGLLNTQITVDGRQLLPPSLNPNDSCNTEQQMKWKQHCFVSGDSRVNEHVLLTVLHTVWMRQHNFIAQDLKDMNEFWDDERLFQESRRIVIAQLQHVTYHEYLPSILGPHLSQGLGLSPAFSGDYWKGYNPEIHPGLANAFSGAAFRFGHSMIQGLVQSIDTTGQNIKFDQLRKYYFSPFSLYDIPTKIPNFVRGQVSQKSAAVDTYFTTQVTNRLFQTKKETHGLDLVSINIQRGRDHGIPAYTRWRMMCGLPMVRNFTDLRDHMDSGALEAIQGVYRDVNDVDLFTGGLAEKPIKDGLIGPTFACIVADQFLRLKKGDRFWYENGPSPTAFTKAQLTELHKTTLARILCDNVMELGSVQRWPLRKFEPNNPRLPCSASYIPSVSLVAWEENKL